MKLAAPAQVDEHSFTTHLHLSNHTADFEGEWWWQAIALEPGRRVAQITQMYGSS